MIYSALRPARVALLAFMASISVLACSGGDRGAASTSASAQAAAAVPVLPDSVSVLADSVMRIADASRVRGDSSAKVWLIIMSDFQCPACRHYHETAFPRIKKEYLDRGLIRLAYVNLPLSIHMHSHTTAERAFCAGLQGKFWEYHDALFKSQSSWERLPAGTMYFDSLAVGLKLDMSDMELCLSSGMMKTLVAADEIRSIQSGAERTPTFLIGGVKVEGSQPFDIFKRYLDAAIAASRGASGGR